MKKWLYFSTLIMAVLISIIISNSNLTLASEESNEVNLTREFLQEATAYEENGIVVLKRERAVSTQSIQSEHIQDVVWLLRQQLGHRMAEHAKFPLNTGHSISAL